MTKTKNIYDMAGNIREITMERAGFSEGVSGGGFYYSDSWPGVTAITEKVIENAGHAAVIYGLRVALYIK